MRTWRKIKRNKKRTVFGLLILLTALLGLTAAIVSMRSSIMQRGNAIDDSIADLNNVIGNLPLPGNLEPGKSGNATYYANSYSAAIEQLDTAPDASLNAIESLLVFDKKSELAEKSTYLQNLTSKTSARLEATRDELAATTKFLEYNAKEDFILLGQDPQNDTDRIKNVKGGFEATTNNVGAYETSRAQLRVAQDALTLFEQNRNTEALHATLQQSQKTIIESLSKRLAELKDEFYQGYSSYIYQ